MAQFAVWKLQIINHLWLLRYFRFSPLGVTKSPNLNWIYTYERNKGSSKVEADGSTKSTLKDCSLHTTLKTKEPASWVWLLWFNITSSFWTEVSCLPVHLWVFLSAFCLPGTSALFLFAWPLVVAGLAAGPAPHSAAELNFSSIGVWTSAASLVTSPKNTTAARLHLSTWTSFIFILCTFFGSCCIW